MIITISLYKLSRQISPLFYQIENSSYLIFIDTTSELKSKQLNTSVVFGHLVKEL